MATTPSHLRTPGTGRVRTPERQVINSTGSPALRVRLKQLPRAVPTAQPTAVPTHPATSLPGSN